MEKRQFFLSLLVLISLSFPDPLQGDHGARGLNSGVALAADAREVRAGVIVNAASPEGKMIQSSISMAISDFYSLHGKDYRSRVMIHERDSGGEPLQALSAAIDLLQNARVEVLILEAESSLEAQIVAELGEKAKVPVIVFGGSSSSSLYRYRYVVEVTHDDNRESEGILALTNKFRWRRVVIIHEDCEDYSRDRLRYLVERLGENGIKILYKGVSKEESFIVNQLRQLRESENTVFVVHMSRSLLPRVFSCARSLGLMDEGYAWVMTAKSMNSFHYMDAYFVKESMQGVIGLKPYVPQSKELRDFTSRWRGKSLGAEVNTLSVFGIWAHGLAWGLARAAETVRTEVSNSSLDLLDTILESKYDGSSSEFRSFKRKMITTTFEVVNILGHADRRVGFWHLGAFTKNLQHPLSNRRRLSSGSNNLETIIWPGGSSLVPQRVLQQKERRKLRILVPASNRFRQLTDVHTDPKTNITRATGFCIEVFETALGRLDEEIDVEYFPWPKGSYDNLVHKVFQKEYDAAVGDITITANRSQYVDFTIPFTDIGLGIVAQENKDLWVFLRPLTGDLWLTSGAFFALTGFIVWLLERPINHRFRGSTSEQIGLMFYFGFSTLVFAQRERLRSNLSRFVVIVWVFVVLILASSYTAMLTSMMTVGHSLFKLNAKHTIGHLSGSYMPQFLNRTRFESPNLRPLLTPKDYAEALSKGSERGGVSAVVDELPYLRVFLGIYSSGYAMVRTNSTANGFAFAFQLGSLLVHNISQHIAKLREEGELQRMEKKWFRSQLQDITEDTVEPLTLYEFRGLFIISGAAFALVLTLFFIQKIREWRDLGDNSAVVPMESGQTSYDGQTSGVIQMNGANHAM